MNAVDPSTNNNDPAYTDPYTPEPYEDPDHLDDPASTSLARQASAYSIAFEPRVTGDKSYAILGSGTANPPGSAGYVVGPNCDGPTIYAAAEDGASPPLLTGIDYSTAAEPGHAPQYDSVQFCIPLEAAVGAKPVYHYQVPNGATAVGAPATTKRSVALQPVYHYQVPNGAAPDATQPAMFDSQSDGQYAVPDASQPAAYDAQNNGQGMGPGVISPVYAEPGPAEYAVPAGAGGGAGATPEYAVSDA